MLQVTGFFRSAAPLLYLFSQIVILLFHQFIQESHQPLFLLGIQRFLIHLPNPLCDHIDCDRRERHQQKYQYDHSKFQGAKCQQILQNHRR